MQLVASGHGEGSQWLKRRAWERSCGGGAWVASLLNWVALALANGRARADMVSIGAGARQLG